MKLFVKAGVLSTLCLVLTAASCGPTKRVVESLPTPPERLICERAGTRPSIPPEYVIDWGVVAQSPTVAEAVRRAKAEVGKLVATVRTREGIVAGYVLKLEGVNFVCWNNTEWRRQYEAGLSG
jgi:hypothetical protein